MSTRRKSSSQVTLILAGAAALAGCNREPTGGKRYASQAECVADWGTPEDCKQDPAAHSGHGGHAWMYYGAGAGLLRNGFIGTRPGAAAGSVSDTSSGTAPRSVSRGGFGTTGRTGASS